jgi:pyridoxine/pyridoxamine 5'-phosphate oxidase
MTDTKQITKTLKTMGKVMTTFFWKETKTTTKGNGTATKVQKQKEINTYNEGSQVRM